MSFLVDDLLDFAQLNSGKFRKVLSNFDLKEAVEEVISIQKDKANMMGVELQSIYKFQSLDTEDITSLFNQETPVSTSEVKGKEKKDDKKQGLQSEEEESEGQQNKNVELCQVENVRKKRIPKLIIKADKRRF